MGYQRMRVVLCRAARVLGMKWPPRRDDESIPDDMITVDEAAKRYGLHPQTVRLRFDSGEWPGRRANGGAGPRMFRASTIEAIEAKKQRPSE